MTTRDERHPCDFVLLFDALRDRSLSMQDIADMFGVSRNTIHRWRTSKAFLKFVAEIEDEVFERTAMECVDDYRLAMEHYRRTVTSEVGDVHAKNMAASKMLEEAHKRRAYRLEAARAIAESEGDDKRKATLAERILDATKAAETKRQAEAN